jgi:hypothetical protein
MEQIEPVLQELSARYSDKRMNIFEIKIESAAEKRLVLSGRVLEQGNLEALRIGLSESAPELRLETSAVRVLRKAKPQRLHVGMNLTSLHDSSSFYRTELTSQLLYGMELEVLEQDQNWVLVRQKDGYIGWTYRPYLTDKPVSKPTHIVIAPAAELRAGANPRGEMLSRVFGGTFVHLESVDGDRAQITANERGWVDLAALRALKDMPKTNTERRGTMVSDAVRMIGVPYLWGGSSVNGIDCSGFTQLVHRWAGVTIPRDADMQYEAGLKVDYPYKPGTLMFFGDPAEKRRVTHVGISLGNWTVMHSSRRRNGVYIEDLQVVKSLRDDFIGAATYLY